MDNRILIKNNNPFVQTKNGNPCLFTKNLSQISLIDYSIQRITNLISGKDNKSRYFNGTQANGLYGLDLFLNFYQNNINSGINDDINATANYVRNPNCWAYDIDLTCCSPWNMHPTLRLSNGSLTGSSNHRGVTLISPRHVLAVRHADFYPPVGSLVRFVTKNNVTITRTIVDLILMPYWHDDVNGTDYLIDLVVGILDSDVPESITFAKILPENYYDKINMHNLLIAFKNQDQSVILQKYNEKRSTSDPYKQSGIQRIGATWDLSPFPLEDFSSEIDSFSVKPPGADNLIFSSFRLYDSGSPIFLIINNEPILIGLVRTLGGGTSYIMKTYLEYIALGKYNVHYYSELINSVMTTLSNNQGISGLGYQLTKIDLNNFPNLPEFSLSPPPEWQTLYGINFLNFDGTNNLYTNYPTIDGPLLFNFQFLSANGTYWFWIDYNTVLYGINDYHTNPIPPTSYLGPVILIYDYIEGIWKITNLALLNNFYVSDFIYSTYDPFNGPWYVSSAEGQSYINGYNFGDPFNAYLSLVNP